MIREAAAGLLVHCFGGCEPGAVYDALRRLGFLDARTAGRRTNRFDYAPRDRPLVGAGARSARALALWHEARNLAGTIVERYFAVRGVDLPDLPSAKLRYHPNCPHPSGTRLPALVALVEHVEQGSIAIHRTYLQPDGSGKAKVDPDKAGLGPVGGGAVRLGMPCGNQWLAICEGIETAASVVAACGLPAWAALSAGNIPKLVLPPEARMVTICADNDENGVGQRAAYEAAERWSAEGRRVRLFMPPLPGTDWNDVLLGKAPAQLMESSHAA